MLTLQYNFMAAFVLCAVLYVAGEWVSTVTKAWIPSVFVTACLMLLCYWHGLPHDVVTDAKLLQAVKEEFKKEVGPDFKYVPLLGDRKPALDYRVVKKE